MRNAKNDRTSRVLIDTWRFLTSLAAILSIGLMASCSDSNFASTGSKAQSNDAKGKGKADALGRDGDGGKGTDGTDGNDGDNGGKGGGKVATVEGTANIGEVFIEVAADGTVTESFKGALTEKATAVDIIFAMDTSGSMNSEKTRLQTNMASFITAFREKAKALDFKIIMIGNNFQFPAADDKLSLVNTTVGSNDALSVLRTYISGPGASVLRTETNKHIVVVTDDNARGTTSATFQTYITSSALMKDRTFAHGLIGLKDGSNNTWCDIAAVGTEYQSLATVTKGTILDLCQEDWSALLNQLATAIITKEAKKEFFLTHKPATTDSMSVSVNGTVLPSSSWQYDASKNSLTIAGASAPKETDKMIVIYKK